LPQLFAGIRQRFSGFSQPRQCGDEALRMLVTGGPPVRGGGGIGSVVEIVTVPFDGQRQVIVDG
jgi:hypothetical protein